MRKLLIALLVLVVVGLGVFFYLPGLLDRKMNTVATPPPYQASAEAEALHKTLFVADLHDDK